MINFLLYNIAQGIFDILQTDAKTGHLLAYCE